MHAIKDLGLENLQLCRTFTGRSICITPCALNRIEGICIAPESHTAYGDIVLGIHDGLEIIPHIGAAENFFIEPLCLWDITLIKCGSCCIVELLKAFICGAPVLLDGCGLATPQKGDDTDACDEYQGIAETIFFRF